jgi:hypothetical protein
MKKKKINITTLSLNAKSVINPTTGMIDPYYQMKMRRDGLKNSRKKGIYISR